MSVLAGNLHGTKSVAVAGNVYHLDAAIAKEVEGLLGRTFCTVPLDGLQVNTFMEAYDFQGKTVIPFATSGGSSIKRACKDLKAAYPNINWKEGKLLNHASKDDMKKWLESN